MLSFSASTVFIITIGVQKHNVWGFFSFLLFFSFFFIFLLKSHACVFLSFAVHTAQSFLKIHMQFPLSIKKLARIKERPDSTAECLSCVVLWAPGLPYDTLLDKVLSTHCLSSGKAILIHNIQRQTLSRRPPVLPHGKIRGLYFYFLM